MAMIKGKMTGGGGGTAKSERKEKRLDAKGERLMAKEGKMISKVKSNATEKLQKLATKESKKVSKMGQDAYWADNIYGSTTSRAKTYAAKANKVESKAKEKVNKIIQKRAK